jgi:N-acetylmuramoyl-L-alanine amidase
MKRRDTLRSLGTVVLLLGARELAYGASILAVRVWPAADYTRVTIESDTPLSERHFLADNPNRLVIDIEGIELSPALRELVGKVRSDDPFIAGVRVGQNQPRTVRLVIDLKQATAPQLFTLTPVAAYQHRMVFDLYPTQERDPLLALIRDKMQAEQQAQRAVQDSLGELIGGGRGRQWHRSPPGRGPADAGAAQPLCHPVQDRPPGGGGARPGPRRRGSGRHRPHRPAREGRGAGNRPAAARPHQRAPGHARHAHA